ncbi:hypothetical protein CJF32_00002944 [Rutstroemia sp. NJR-2017a WRK4]|nr:hypothetical protein CJF32_00002944 [Rutstroemia sp. NJR-2017a WRK4]
MWKKGRQPTYRIKIRESIGKSTWILQNERYIYRESGGVSNKPESSIQYRRASSFGTPNITIPGTRGLANEQEVEITDLKGNRRNLLQETRSNKRVALSSVDPNNLIEGCDGPTIQRPGSLGTGYYYYLGTINIIYNLVADYFHLVYIDSQNTRTCFLINKKIPIAVWISQYIYIYNIYNPIQGLRGYSKALPLLRKELNNTLDEEYLEEYYIGRCDSEELLDILEKYRLDLLLLLIILEREISMILSARDL